MRKGAVLIGMMLMTTVSAWAQDTNGIAIEQDLEQLPPLRSTTLNPQAGQTADSTAGQVGVRQTRDLVEGVNPTARINNRVANRVQSRLRTRIDRSYDPHASTTSPFEVAAEGTRRAGQRPR